MEQVSLKRKKQRKRSDMYPQVVINKKQIIENVNAIRNKTSKHDVTVTAVTKCLAGNVEIAQAFIDAGITKLGDSRIYNLKKLAKLHCETWLIRLPMLSECSDVVRYADVSLNSELVTIQRLNEEATKLDKVHGIVLMVDVGDLREGIFVGGGALMSAENENLAEKTHGELYNIIECILEMKHVKLLGFGTNSTCYGSTIPEKDTFQRMLQLVEEVEEKYGIKSEVVSGGNSSCYYLLEENELPEGITNMRLGELILFGRECSYHIEYPYLHQDNVILKTEVIEVKKKPSYPIGKIGMNSFGEVCSYEDKGIRTRVIVAIGQQDISLNHLKPIDEGVTIEGASSDHMMLDVTDALTEYTVGDIIEFACDYASTLALCTSEYIETKIIE